LVWAFKKKLGLTNSPQSGKKPLVTGEYKGNFQTWFPWVKTLFGCPEPLPKNSFPPNSNLPLEGEAFQKPNPSLS